MKYRSADDHPKPVYTQQQAKVKVSRYCAYQERSQHQVRQKLSEMGFYGAEAEEIIADLITDGFINEERFARAYAGGKFRTKQWGRRKIEQGLQQHRISAYCLRAAMQEIEPEAYWQTLLTLVRKRWQHEHKHPEYLRKQKVARYLLGRGYEQDLIWDALAEVMQDNGTH